MINQIFITVILLFFLCFEIFFLGKKISQKNNLFINNVSAVWLLGVISYLGITFLFFLPFVWLEINFIYYLIIFVFKELVILAFIFLGKEKISFNNINYLNLIYTFLVSLSITFLFNFLIYQERPIEDISIYNNYFSKPWILFQNIFNNVSSIDKTFINMWLIGFLSSTVICTSVNSFMIWLCKSKNLFIYILSGLISLCFIFIFNFNQNLNNLLASYLTFFSLFLALNILQFSRKRYSFVFIINFLVAFMINYRVFIALSSVAIATAIIYSLVQKPMPTLFWVQLTTPIFIVLASWVGELSFLLMIILIILILIYYIGLTFLVPNNFFVRVNFWTNKHAKWFPYSNLLIILLVSIIILTLKYVDVKQIIDENNVVFDYNFFSELTHIKKIFYFVQWIIYGFTILLLIVIISIWKIKQVKFFGIKNILLIIMAIFIFIYNPIFNTILISINLQNNFTYLRSVTFMPIILFCFVTIYKFVTKKTLVIF